MPAHSSYLDAALVPNKANQFLSKFAQLAMPHRGKMNEPAFVRHIGEYLADLKGLPVKQVQEITSNNFFELFKISR